MPHTLPGPATGAGSTSCTTTQASAILRRSVRGIRTVQHRLPATNANPNKLAVFSDPIVQNPQGSLAVDDGASDEAGRVVPPEFQSAVAELQQVFVGAGRRTLLRGGRNLRS